jgi:hypothetical protein
MPFPAIASYAGNYIGGALMGLGYTSGAYTGYGLSNTVDPLSIHNKSLKSSQFQQISLGMPYGNYGYRRRYRRRYSRYSYGRRSRYGYRRRSYGRYSRFY